MDLKLDSSRDLAIENNDFVLLSGLEAIQQDLDDSLRLLLGEWFLDTRQGIPLFEKILGQKPRLAVVTSIFRDAVLRVNGILNIFDLVPDFDAQTRTLTISFRAIATEGEFEYSKEFIV